MKTQLSDGSEYKFDGGRQSLNKYVTFSEIKFWIHKFPSDQMTPYPQSPYPYHTYTINAKIGAVYYTVMLNDNFEVVVQESETAGKKNFSVKHSFDVDPNLFVEAAKLANLVDFAHSEIIKALGAVNPEAVDSLPTGVVASMFEMEGTE